ncbi:vitamin B6 photo-protection and homoeostasis-domain-containing protein [Hypoxylon sp. NC1633]|nr:vitamin B6 photo-protection and homoeostasis-domain-containing protein [Hypoxylon sp. NC1633]
MEDVHPVKAVNESGTVICTFASGKIVAPKKTARTYARGLLDVFLPAGYPHTVTSDYTPYQVYDSLQAFFSTIAGLLSSRAVLQGLGVGDSASSATAAVLLSVLQESTGRLATILFAHRYGRGIEAECKFYRFLADIVNDSALFLDIISPALSTYPKVLALCAAGILRALCGISGGAAKASLSAHFARSGNIAELNAKDGSQETVISLMGMLAGSLFVQVVHGREAVMAWMIVLVSLHLWTNYQAVRSVHMNTLTKQRLSIILEHWKNSGTILTPKKVAAKESILGWSIANPSFAQTSSQLQLFKYADVEKYADVGYLIVNTDRAKTTIFMKEHTPADQNPARSAIETWIESSTGKRVGSLIPLLEAAGWDVDTNALETGHVIRISGGDDKLWRRQ